MSPLLQQLDGRPAASLAVVDERGEHSWEAIRAASMVAARRLTTLAEPADVPGEGRVGPRVGVLVEPGHRWLAAMLGIWRAGMVAVPLSPRHPDRELRALLDDAGAALIVHDAPNHRPALPIPPIATDALFEASSAPTPLPIANEPLAMLLYTSGTTGRPKGVRLGHRQLAHQAGLLVDAWALAGRRALLHALPLHHMHGIAIALLPCLLAGMHARMIPRFEARAVWEALGEVDTFMGVPTMYHRLLDAFDDASAEARQRWSAAARSIGLFTSGSAALPVTLAERWSAVAGRIPLERYGMTEIGVGCSNPLPPTERRRGWVGRPLPTLEIRILDEDGRAGDGPGMLEARGPGVFDGYWRRPDATADAFHDGWFVTGDVAERDGTGFVKLLGRSSVDILKSGGYKLSALEIEEHLRDHEAVAEVAVVGLPDAIYGQVVAAVVVPHPTRRAEPSQLRLWLADRIAGYKIPRRWAVVEELPKNALGKVLKPALVAELTAESRQETT